MNKFTPLFDYVVIKPIEADSVTKSGIVVTGAKERPQTALVIEVGNGAAYKDHPKQEMYVKKGQKVIYKKWNITEMEFNKEKYFVIKQEDIMAVID